MRATTHYDMIPTDLLHGTILDVGCGDGSNQRMSNHSDLLQGEKYTGIDMIQGQNLLSFDTTQQYDTVLAIHVIEHVHVSQWPAMFERLQSWVAPHGTLVLGCPYDQSSAVYAQFTGPENQRHRVFGITFNMLEEYITPLICRTYQGPYSQSLMCIWRKRA